MTRARSGEAHRAEAAVRQRVWFKPVRGEIWTAVYLGSVSSIYYAVHLEAVSKVKSWGCM